MSAHTLVIDSNQPHLSGSATTACASKARRLAGWIGILVLTVMFVLCDLFSNDRRTL